MKNKKISNKKKEFINEETAQKIAQIAIDALGAEYAASVKKYNFKLEDVIRYRIVGEKLKEKREKEGISIKQASTDLKIPQYKIGHYMEGNTVKHIKKGLLEKYIKYLELDQWFEKWKEHNMDVYDRLGKEIRG